MRIDFAMEQHFLLNFTLLLSTVLISLNKTILKLSHYRYLKITLIFTCRLYSVVIEWKHFYKENNWSVGFVFLRKERVCALNSKKLKVSV